MCNNKVFKVFKVIKDFKDIKVPNPPNLSLFLPIFIKNDYICNGITQLHS